MTSIQLNLKVREARAVASILPTLSASSKVNLNDIKEQLRPQLEAYDENRKRDREEKLRLKRLADEQKRLERLCAVEGHPDLAWDSAIHMIDAQTISGMAVRIPECVSCHELVLKLADGSLKRWLDWTETKEPLHLDMLGRIEELKPVQRSRE